MAEKCVVIIDDSGHRLKIGDIVTPDIEYEDGSPPLVNRKEKWRSGYGGGKIGLFGRIVRYERDNGNPEIPELMLPWEYAVVEDMMTGEEWSMSEQILCLVSDKLKEAARYRAEQILKPRWKILLRRIRG